MITMTRAKKRWFELLHFNAFGRCLLKFFNILAAFLQNIQMKLKMIWLMDFKYFFWFKTLKKQRKFCLTASNFINKILKILKILTLTFTMLSLSFIKIRAQLKLLIQITSYKKFIFNYYHTSMRLTKILENISLILLIDKRRKQNFRVWWIYHFNTINN